MIFKVTNELSVEGSPVEVRAFVEKAEGRQRPLTFENFIPTTASVSTSWPPRGDAYEVTIHYVETSPLEFLAQAAEGAEQRVKAIYRFSSAYDPPEVAFAAMIKQHPSLTFELAADIGANLQIVYSSFNDGDGEPGYTTVTRHK